MKPSTGGQLGNLLLKRVVDAMNLEYATTLILFVLFVAAEIYRLKRGRPGVIVSMNDSEIPLPVSTVTVRLRAGDVVTAQLNCCTACLGRLEVGDEVRVGASREGYVVDLPWFGRRQCADSGEMTKCQTRSGMKHVDP